jgi:hypothetical protein
MKSKYLLTIAISCLISVSMTGCYTGMYLLSLPQRFSLPNPQPPRYFKLSLDIGFDKQPQTIEYIWSCEQKPHSSLMTTGRWNLRWEYDDKGFIVKILPDNSAIFFHKPSEYYCDNDNHEYAPNIVVIPNVEHIDSLKIYRSRVLSAKPASKLKINGVVQRLSAPTPELPLTEQEKQLTDLLENHSGNFVSRDVFIIPELIWSKRLSKSRYSLWNNNFDLVGYLRNLTKITKAPQSTVITHMLLSNPYSIDKDQDISKIKYFSLDLTNNELIVDPDMIPNDWTTYKLEPKDDNKPVKFCYKNHCEMIDGSINDFYDPETHDIIRVQILGNYLSTFYSKLGYSGYRIP